MSVYGVLVLSYSSMMMILRLIEYPVRDTHEWILFNTPQNKMKLQRGLDVIATLSASIDVIVAADECCPVSNVQVGMRPRIRAPLPDETETETGDGCWMLKAWIMMTTSTVLCDKALSKCPQCGLLQSCLQMMQLPTNE